MNEKPRLLNAPMVRATLDGTKTQTRQIVSEKFMTEENGFDNDGVPLNCPFGNIGGQLWVRENFKVLGASGGWESSSEAGLDFEEGAAKVFYPADKTTILYDCLVINDNGIDEGEQAVRFSKKNGINPSIHMPRWASRIDLLITDICVERIQDISEDDALAEGIIERHEIVGATCAGGSHTEIMGARYYYDIDEEGYESAYEAFEALWVSIYGQESWDANPWVWVADFERIKP